MSKEGIIDYFEGLNRGILDKCNPTDSAENNRMKRVTVKGSSIGDKVSLSFTIRGASVLDRKLFPK